jgi:Protein of unknown function (DUF1552)
MDPTSRLKRRTFLSALGLGISAPLAAQMARRAVAAPSDRPRRLLLIFIPHGMPAEHFDPGGQGRSFDLAANPLVGVLAPFQPYQDQFILPRGIEYTGHTQHATIAAVLTGDTDTSVDAVVARSLGTRSLLLGALAYLKDQFGPDSKLFSNVEWVAPENNPLRAAASLGAGSPVAGSPGPGPALIDDDEFQKAALAVGIAELEAMQRELASLTSVQSRLSVHLASLRSLKERGAGGAGPGGGPPPAACGMAPLLPAVEVVRQESGNGQNADYFFDKTRFKQLLLAQLQVASHALLCGTRVVGLQAMWANAQINFGFMGIAKDHHDPVSHSRDTAGRAEFAQVQRWIYSQIEEQVLRPLRAAPDPFDPAHNVLDNTCVYISSEIADGNEHNCRKAIIELGPTKVTTLLPLMLIGGGGGALATGQIVDFENRSHKDLLASLCLAMGAPGGAYSDNPVREILS